MATTPTLTLTGESGTAYTFNVYLQEAKFPAVGGVYCVTVRTPTADGGGSHTVKYIGITEDLSTRFNNHHKSDDFKKHKTTNLCVYYCDDAKKRATIEKDLCAKYKPVCNDKLVA